MRKHTVLMIPVLLAFATWCPAQQYELGALGGYGTAFGLSAKSAAGASADTGIRGGIALGVFFSDSLYGRLGGEFHYLYRAGRFRVESGGEKAELAGRSHLFHYDFVYHTTPPGERIRPFASAGIGGRVYQATGIERAFQPLQQFVVVTKTSDGKVLLTIGGGVKYLRSNGMILRFEVRDYFTPAPTGILFPPPGAKVGGWLHDVVPQVGIAYTF